MVHNGCLSLSAAPVHLCADKTRVFDIKLCWELTHTQDKYPSIHLTIKYPKIQVLNWCGVSFHMKGIPSRLCDNIIYTLLTHMQPVNQYVPIQCTHLWSCTAEIKEKCCICATALSAVLSKCVHSENKSSSAAANYITEPIGSQRIYVVETYSEWRRRRRGSDHNKSVKGWTRSYVVKIYT